MKITVIITSYNHEKYLRQSIDSVLNQTYKEFELILVDDCSQDASWEIICEYKREHPEIIAIRSDHNSGGEIVADAVINYATGDYIAMQHSDDFWEPDKLQKQVEAMQKMPGCAAVFTNAVAVDDDGNVYNDENGFYFELFFKKNRSRYEWLNYFFYHGNCLCHPSVLIKRDVYADGDFLPKGLQQIPDFIKWIQVCKKYDIYILEEPLVKFRIHADGKNSSGMRADTQIRSTIELFLMLREYVTIRDKDEFLKIFPEALQYCRGEFFQPEYVFGRMCTEERMPAYTRLFGMQLLYQVLNYPEWRQKIEDEYSYTAMDFRRNNGKYDVFGILPEAFEQTRTLYFDTGHGFDGEESCSQKFTLGEAESFEWTCKIKLNDGKKINTLRFDPVEGVMVKVKLDKVLVNGVEVSYIGENALCSEDELQIFVNLDPIYTITIPEQIEIVDELEIVLIGEVERLTKDEIDQIVSKVMYDKRDEIYDYQKKVYEKEEELRTTTEELRTTTEELRTVSDELNMIKTSRVYKLMRRFIEKKSN